MISDENLKQLRAMIAELLDEKLEAWGLEKRPSVGALRTRRYRQRQASQSVTGKSQSVTASGLERHKTSRPVTKRHNGHADDSPVFIGIPLNDGSEYPITQKTIDELGALYPAVDVPQTFREIRGWSIANQQKRKTRLGVMRFVASWLQREQNKG